MPDLTPSIRTALRSSTLLALVLALAPRRVEDALRALASLTVENRRLVGLGALALGVALVWLGRPL